jgi:hypothetical protein
MKTPRLPTMRRLARRSRFLTAFLLPVIAALVSTQVAYASPPSDNGTLPLPMADCAAGAPDTGGAHICKLRIFDTVNWQASTGEWIVVRGGDGEDTLTNCLSIQRGVVVTYTINGTTFPADTFPCQDLSSPGAPFFFVDWRLLSHPLPSGVYTFTETAIATANLPDGTPAGATWFSASSTPLTVVPKG